MNKLCPVCRPYKKFFRTSLLSVKRNQKRERGTKPKRRVSREHRTVKGAENFKKRTSNITRKIR